MVPVAFGISLWFQSLGGHLQGLGAAQRETGGDADTEKEAGSGPEAGILNWSDFSSEMSLPRGAPCQCLRSEKTRRLRS